MALTALVVALAMSPLAAPSDGDVEQARVLISENRYDDAIRLLSSALSSNPDDVDVAVTLADAQRRAGRFSAALETLDGFPDVYAVSLARAKAYEAMLAEAKLGPNSEDAEFYALDAKTHYEEALADEPDDDHRARAGLGLLNLYELGDHREAYRLAEEGLAESPDAAELRLLRGQAGVYVYYYSLGAGNDAATHEAWKTSVEDLLAANEALPTDRLEPLGQLCYMYDQKGLPLKAVDAAIELYDRQPSFDTLYHYAKKYSGTKQHEAAAKALEKMVMTSARDLTERIAAEPDTDAVATQLHYSISPLVADNDFGTARAILAAIVETDPQAPIIWNNYGVVCESSSKFDDAVAAYERSLEIDPTQAGAHKDLAILLHETLDKEHDRSKQLYQRCIDLAEEQLADESRELTSAERAELVDARKVARESLAKLEPAQRKSGLLDSMLEGVRNLDLPDLDEGEDDGADGGTDDGSGDA